MITKSTVLFIKNIQIISILIILITIPILNNPTPPVNPSQATPSTPSLIPKSTNPSAKQTKPEQPHTQDEIKIPLPPINFTNLNHKLQTLNPRYLQQFSTLYTEERIRNFNDQEAGEYLFLLGKMYLYDILPYSVAKGRGQTGNNQQQLRYQTKSKYILGYFYIKLSAEVYQIADAYYYLALLQYMKLTPITLIKTNIKKIIKSMKSSVKSKSSLSSNHNMEKLLKQWQEELLDREEVIEVLEDMVFDMETHHLHNTQHNLYLASIFGQVPAKLSLAYMLKDGISTDKNCSAAIGYYLSAMKNIKIDTFQFPSDYIDHKNFQKQLYARKKLDLKGYGQYDPSVLMQTAMFDQQTLHAYEDVAMKYMSGEDGFPINQTISVRMFQKMVHTSKIARIMLGFMYLKGRGVPKNFEKAREMFEIQAKVSKVAKQTILAMKFFQLGYKGQKQKALVQIRDLYLEYERKMIRIQNATLNVVRNKPKTGDKDPKKQEPKEKQQQQQKQTEKTSKRQKIDTFRTPMMKYIAGSLVLSEQIKATDKKYAILLIDQAAKQGNTLALTQMGLIMIDGSDSSFDCERASNYFSKQSLSLVAFQQRIQLAKLGIKNQKYFFSFMKYIQLMMAGYRNAFVNALYLMEVYGEEMLQFRKQSWSVAQVKKNSVYRFLVKEKVIENIDPILLDTFAPSGQNIFSQKNLQFLTQIQPEPNTPPKQKPNQLQQYINYMNLKITSIGIQKHQISILKFYKYKQAKDISILHQLANTGQDSPHIYESRFLLGQYYHHTNISGVNEEIRFRRAIEEYNRATKNRLLAEMIYVYEGGEFKESQRIVSHLLWYLTALIIVGVCLYWKKNKRIQQILMLQQKKQQEQQNQINRLKQLETNKTSSQDKDKQQVPLSASSQLKRNQFLFHSNKNKNQPLDRNQYKGPRFSEEEEENMVRSRNFLNIGYLMDERMRSVNKGNLVQSQQRQKQKQKQEEKIDLQNINDKNQPIISNDEQQGKKPHYQ